MEANFNPAFTLPSNSMDDHQMNDQTKMSNAFRSSADEGCRSFAAEVFSTPALHTGPKKDQTKMDMRNQSSAAGKSTLAVKTGPKSTLAVKTGPKMADFHVERKRAIVRCRVCGEQGHNRRSCFKFQSFKESISRH